MLIFLFNFYDHSQIGLIPYKRMVREVLSCFAVSVTDNEATFKAVFELGLSRSEERRVGKEC